MTSRSGEYLLIKREEIYKCTTTRSRASNEQYADAVLEAMSADYGKYTKDGARTTPGPEVTPGRRGRNNTTRTRSPARHTQNNDDTTRGLRQARAHSRLCRMLQDANMCRQSKSTQSIVQEQTRGSAQDQGRGEGQSSRSRREN